MNETVVFLSKIGATSLFTFSLIFLSIRIWGESYVDRVVSKRTTRTDFWVISLPLATSFMIAAVPLSVALLMTIWS